MGGHSNSYENKQVLVNKLSIRGGWMVKKGQQSVYVVIECPLMLIDEFSGFSVSYNTSSEISMQHALTSKLATIA